MQRELVSIWRRDRQDGAVHQRNESIGRKAIIHLAIRIANAQWLPGPALRKPGAQRRRRSP